MSKPKKTTISDLLGWLVGSGFVVDAALRDAFLLRAALRRSFEYIPSAYDVMAKQAAGFVDLSRTELIFGMLVMIAVSWIRKTRNEAINDMKEANGMAVDNTPPKSEGEHHLTP